MLAHIRNRIQEIAMSYEIPGGVHAEEREYIAVLLSRYPNLSESELGEIRNWFERVATPLDFGMMASDPATQNQYRAYRKDHHDRFKMRDVLTIAMFLAVGGGVIGLIAIFMP